MKNSKVEIKTNQDLRVINSEDIIKYISSVSNPNEIEWLISLYNNFKSNREISNTNKIVAAARQKLQNLGIDLDKHGNFNVQSVDVSDLPKQKIIIADETINSDLSVSSKNYDELEPHIGDYINVFSNLREKTSLGYQLTNDEILTQMRCIKRMLIELPEKGYGSTEYTYLKNYFEDYLMVYYEQGETINEFLSKSIEKFLEIDKELKKNVQIRNSKILSYRNLGAANIVILLEIALLGILGLMFIS